MRSRELLKRNSGDCSGLAARREQGTPDFTVARNCLGVLRECVFQAGSEQTQCDRVRDQQNLLQLFSRAVFAKLL